MNSDCNIISITGKIVESHDDYYLIKVSRISGVEDYFRVWNMPRPVPVDAEVTVVGELTTEQFGEETAKIILGIDAKILVTHGHTHNMLIVTGTVISKPAIRVTRTEKVIQELVIETAKGGRMPVLIWNELARQADSEIELGDRVEISGFLTSRVYAKEMNGVKVMKPTTEISTIFFKKIA